MNVSEIIGAEMPTAEPALQRLRMSWEEYLELPEKPKAEWVDGEVVVTPPVSAWHGYGASGLIAAFVSAFPGLHVMTEVGLSLPRNRLRAPDVMVVEELTDDTWVTEAPVLVVEVLSRATRSEDTVRKATEYAEGGVGQYWLLDPELRCLDVYRNEDGGWDPLLHLDDDHPVGRAVVGEHGEVGIDLAVLLPPR